MPFIGIIAKEKDVNFIKNIINQNVDERKFEVINVNKKSIENIKNIKFDVLIINENIDEILKESKYIENIINKTKYIIMNTDLENNICATKKMNANIITYGFNEKATITVSSIKDNKAMICIQRKILDYANYSVEEQEIGVKLEKNNQKNLYNILIIFTILVIFGIKLKKNQQN